MHMLNEQAIASPATAPVAATAFQTQAQPQHLMQANRYLRRRFLHHLHHQQAQPRHLWHHQPLHHLVFHRLS